jgi:hypothetical protein
VVDDRTLEMGRTWRRCNPAHARALDRVNAQLAQRPRPEVIEEWGRFVVKMAERVAEGRPLSRRQDYALIGALRDAHARRQAPA